LKTSIGKDPREAHRLVVKAWIMEAVTRSGVSIEALSIKMGRAPQWLLRIYYGRSKPIAPMKVIEQIADVTGYHVSDQVIQAISYLKSTSQFWSNQEVTPPTAEDAGSPVALEMMKLIHQAVTLRGERKAARNIEIVQLSFGLREGRPMKVSTIAAMMGVSRPHVLAKISSTLADLQSDRNKATPWLLHLWHTVRDMEGAAKEDVQDRLADLLGSVPLLEALRFYNEIQDEKVDLTFLPVHRAPERRNLTSPVEIPQALDVANRLQNYAGACRVADFKTFLESKLRRRVTIGRLRAAIEGLPNHRWLGTDKRWFEVSQTPGELTPMLRSVAKIIQVAKQSVDIETIYGGLCRASRGDRQAEAAEFTELVPPLEIVRDVLVGHPAFTRHSYSSLFSLVVEDMGWGTKDTNESLILAAMGASNSALTVEDCRSIRRADGEPLAINSIYSVLYTSCAIQRHGQRAYGIRGREVPE